MLKCPWALRSYRFRMKWSETKRPLPQAGGGVASDGWLAVWTGVNFLPAQRLQVIIDKLEEIKPTCQGFLCVWLLSHVIWGKEHLAYPAGCCKDQAFILQIFKKPPWAGQSEGSLSFCPCRTGSSGHSHEELQKEKQNHATAIDQGFTRD